MIRHGHCCNGKPSSTYNAWASMIQRCTNPTAKDWYYYGGRGIRLDPRWSLFTDFLADMGERPNGTSLDRVDNNGDYYAANCRWATKSQQARNRRSSKLTSDCVARIRDLGSSGAQHRDIGRWFGVSHTMIGYILRGKSWAQSE